MELGGWAGKPTPISCADRVAPVGLHSVRHSVSASGGLREPPERRSLSYADSVAPMGLHSVRHSVSASGVLGEPPERRILSCADRVALVGLHSVRHCQCLWWALRATRALHAL